MAVTTNTAGDAAFQAMVFGFKHRIREELRVHLMEEAKKHVDAAVDEAVKSLDVSIQHLVKADSLRHMIEVVVRRETK